MIILSVVVFFIGIFSSCELVMPMVDVVVIPSEMGELVDQAVDGKEGTLHGFLRGTTRTRRRERCHEPWFPVSWKKYIFIVMNNFQRVAVACAALSFIGAGCAASAPTPAAPATPSAVAPSAPAPAPVAPAAQVPDACTVVTREILKDKLGADYDAGKSEPSNLQGSTCVFKVSGNLFNLATVQLSPNPVYYMQESWVKNGQPLGVGEKGIYTYTSNEYSTQGWFQFIKNGKLAVVTVGAKTKFTDAQLKAFAQMIADAF